MLDWKLRKSEIKNLKEENETTGRLNRNLLNYLTINAENQTEIKIVGKLKQSNFIKTRYSGFLISPHPIDDGSRG